MKKNRLGNTDIFVSPVSFGVLTVGNTQLNLPVKEGAALIKYAVSKGINLIRLSITGLILISEKH